MPAQVHQADMDAASARRAVRDSLVGVDGDEEDVEA